MTRDVSVDMAKLTALAAVVAVGVTVGWAPIGGLAVAIGMLVLLSLALVSPAGPTVLFDNPGDDYL